MVRDATDSEYLLTRKTAEEYRSMGYEVLLEASLDFFPNFRADLLVRKGDEVKVIEVKSRPSLAANPKIVELARIIDSKPGWSFELLLVGEPEKVDSPEGARSLGSENILQRIEEAEKSLEAGLPEAAFLLAWSAFEAATRELSSRGARSIEYGHHVTKLRSRPGDFSRRDLKGRIQCSHPYEEVPKCYRARVQCG